MVNSAASGSGGALHRGTHYGERFVLLLAAGAGVYERKATPWLIVRFPAGLRARDDGRDRIMIYAFLAAAPAVYASCGWRYQLARENSVVNVVSSALTYPRRRT